MLYNTKSKIFACLLVMLMLCIPFFVTPEVFAATEPTGTGTGSGATSSGTDTLTETLCKAINFVTSGPGKAIAIIVIISMAIMLFLGKVSWGIAIMVVVGMGLLFGANSVVTAISPDSKDVCAGITAN